LEGGGLFWLTGIRAIPRPSKKTRQRVDQKRGNERRLRFVDLAGVCTSRGGKGNIPLHRKEGVIQRKTDCSREG